MSRRNAILSAIALALLTQACASWPKIEPRPKAKWTVMLYLNGDNDLEDDMVADFREIADVGSTDDINVIVLFDRHDRNNHLTDPDWDETYLFHVRKDQEPIPDNAITKKPIAELNMGSGTVVRRFVRWSREHFPAERYALIFSSHGTGPRMFRYGFFSRQIRADISDASYRALSPDAASFRDHLYVRELADSVRQAMRDEDLELIGMDACLMGMMENAYALRNVGRVFVGSEELVPEKGWPYQPWLATLVANPRSNGVDVGRSILEAYKAEAVNDGDETRTLSVVDLTKLPAAATAISDLAKSVMTAPRAVWDDVVRLRDQCEPYGCHAGFCFNHIDAARFTDLLRSSSDGEVAARATAATAAIGASVVDRYAGTRREGRFGSHGLAIYFPIDRSAYRADPFHKNGYETWNLYYPLEFVEDTRWPFFLRAYFAAADRQVTRSTPPPGATPTP